MSYPIRIVAMAFMVAASLCPSWAQGAGLEHATQARLLEEATEAFRAGNALLNDDPEAAQDEYEKATLRMERIVREGGVENGKLYYNLGNIWYQRGDLGRALVHYLRAEQFMPHNVQLQQNLAFVRAQRTDAFEVSEKRKLLETLFFWHYDISSHTRLRLFGGAFILIWVLATIRLFWKRRELTLAAGACAVVAGLLFFSLSLEASQYRNNPRGVVVADEVVARKGDGETYQPSFSDPLHAGTEFTVTEDRGSWLHITLPDERTCWIPRSAMALVQHPLGEGA